MKIGLGELRMFKGDSGLGRNNSLQVCRRIMVWEKGEWWFRRSVLEKKNGLGEGGGGIFFLGEKGSGTENGLRAENCLRG